MIYTITFNPSIDYMITVEDFTTGTINRTNSERIYAGGKGINVSFVLSELGIENTALGFVAGFTGKQLLSILQDKKIHTDFITVQEGMTRINVKLRSKGIEGVETAETEINGRGPCVSEEEIKQLIKKISAITKEDVLIISGSVPQGVPTGIYADLLKLCNEKNIKVIVDASGPLLWNVLEYKPFLIKPNHHELGDIFNREISSRDEVIFYARELQNRGASNVLVSLGGAGAILVAENGEIYEENAPNGQVLNSVGAGDSMVAGFVYGLFGKDLQEYDYVSALHMGICAGSATAFSMGLATKKEIELLYNSENSEKPQVNEEDMV